MDAIVLLSAGSSEIFVFMDAFGSLGLRRKRPSETSACMDAIVLLRAGLSEIFASLDTFVSLRLQRERLGETNAFVHAFISLGAASVKPLRPWTPMFHPACRATGWTARARQGVFLVRVSCGKCLPRPRLHQTRNGSWCSRCVGQFVTQSRRRRHDANSESDAESFM